MKITNDVVLHKSASTGEITLALSNGTHSTLSTSDKNYITARQMYNDVLRCGDREQFYTTHYEDFKAIWNIDDNIITFSKSEIETTAEPPKVDEKEVVTEALGRMIDFFKEFAFAPNFRFINSVGIALSKSKTAATSYITNYFKLIDSPYAKEVTSKMNSAEFKGILNDLALIPPTHSINSRCKLYYGEAGTGKTTYAQKETPLCIPCNNSMLPADLMEDFTFINGQPSFKPSKLWECMEQGKAIVLDEINLLPFDSLRFLQGILDGKSEIIYKGNVITIAEGFQVIGTMNLVVNGTVFNLPEPLVDRCSEIREFTLSAKQLLSALI